ncbi:2-hydroxyacid dehydrogenase [Undibacterium umbellatum]|uniref:Glyoxylate/hydroxypyruvate reductase A n=1 Tax=Undibacterium umbellatum TaxID=2762300 RepID=A0ABR6Z3E5_9BURK|nr:glyoxylate/hydroxypyruvate reductase A [Undibacterium umbellatum]MBC3906252.1 glyoxylate/hydroxypyruvate reductase A [Undibacterium umbellatum]
MKSNLIPNVIPFLAAPGYAHTQAWVQALQTAMPEEQIVAFDDMTDEAKAACKVAIVANPNPAELQQLPQLQWVHSVWAGVERLVEDLGKTDLKIVRLVDPQLASTMAEAVLAWALYLHREIPAYAKQQVQKKWQPREYVPARQRTISLLGLGALGEAAAQSLLQAGFTVCGWSRSHKSVAGVECFNGENELPAMLAKTDILVCLLPLTPDTKGLINTHMLAQLPQGGSLINFARGAIVNDKDLHAALESSHITHAVLDVFAIEPLPVSEWHWQHPHVSVLPHCAAPTDRKTASAIVAENILRYRISGELPQTVDIARGY